MSNTHLVPDLHYETQAIDGDLLPSAVLSTTFPTVPVSSMTLAAFPTQAYVRVGSPIRLVYVNQPAHSVTLTGADGAYWLAVTNDTHTPITSWSRVPGTHYAWRASATRPAQPDGTLLLAQVTVAGGVITAVDTSTTVTPHNRIAYGGITGALTFDHRLIWDTFTPRFSAFSQAHITGPVGLGVAPVFDVTLNVAGRSYFDTAVGIGIIPSLTGPTLDVGGTLHVLAAVGIAQGVDPLYALALTGNTYLGGQVGIGIAPTTALDVNGGLRVRGFSTFDNAVDMNGSLTVDGLIQLGGVVQLLDTLTVNGAVDFNGNLTVDGLTQLGGAVQLLSTLTVNGAVDLNTTLNVDGQAQFNQAIGVQAAINPAFAITALSLAVLNPSTFGSTVQVAGRFSIGGTTSDAYSFIDYPRATHYGLKIKPSDNDTGAGSAVLFANQANGAVGSIHTTSTTTAYNTASDARLKRDVHTLTGELAIIQALRPVAFRWNSDNSQGVGFLASEVSAALAGVITGAPDAVEPDGTIRPQMINLSALVPFLTGAVKTLAARLAVLEDALGV